MTTTTTSEMTFETKAYLLATVHPDESFDIEKKVGYRGRTKTVRILGVRVRWYIDLSDDRPKWNHGVKVIARNILKDGSIGAPVEVWEYGNYGTWKDSPLSKFVAAAIESTRPATVPTITITPGA